MKPILNLVVPSIKYQIPGSVAFISLLTTRYSILFLILITQYSLLHSQTWLTNTGAKIYVAPNAAVNVEGNIYHDSTSILHNYGTVKTGVTRTWGVIELKGNEAVWKIDSNLILENGKLSLHSNILIVNNSDTSAIEADAGKIVAEDSLWGKVRWHIGENTGMYVVPFGTDSLQDISVSLEIDEAGDSSGFMEFSTFKTSNGNLPKPFEVRLLRFASAGIDTHALSIADRYWLLNAQGYSQNPRSRTLLKYRTNELGGENEIEEDSMIASRLGNRCWKDWTPITGELITAQKQFRSDTSREYSIMVMHKPLKWEKAGSISHFNKPISPAPQVVLSDTAYPITFSDVTAKYWGNQIEWAFDSSFASSQIGASPHDITVTLNPMTDTLLWVRARDSISNCFTEAVTTIAIVDTTDPQEPPTDTFPAICAGTDTIVQITDSENDMMYLLRIHDVAIDSALGNDSLLSLNTGAIDTSTLFNLIAVDTLTLDTTVIDSAIIWLAVDPVETPVFTEGDDFIYINDSVCYFAAAENNISIFYTVATGADVDSFTGCVSNITGDFRVKATAIGLPGCGTSFAYYDVEVTDIAAPIAPEWQYVVADSLSQVIEFTFDSIYAGSGGDQIEWATNIDFQDSEILNSPATINISVEAGKDTVIWIRSRYSRSGEVSRMQSSGARAMLPLLSAGLLDKSQWTLIPDWSDEFNYDDDGIPSFPDQYPNTFQTKWALNYCWEGLGGPCDPGLECGRHTLLGDEKQYYNSGNNDIGTGGEVFFTNGTIHLQATRVSPSFTQPVCGSRKFDYKSGAITARNTTINISTPCLFEIRCKVPGKGAWPAFWIWGGNVEFDFFDDDRSGPSSDPRYNKPNNWTRSGIHDHGELCPAWFYKQTPCDFTEDWHTYSCMISSSEIVFFIDGKETWSALRDANDPFPATLPTEMILMINLAVVGMDSPSYDFQIDYVRFYRQATNPPAFLQNVHNNGVAKTLESPNVNGVPTNNKKVYITNSGSYHQTVAIDGSKISVVDTGNDVKVFYKKYGITTCYVSSIDNSGNWVEHRLVDNGTFPGGGWITEEPRVYDCLTPANGSLVYYEGYEDELMYFKKTGQTWGVYQAYAYNNTLYPVKNCTGYIAVTNAGTVYYKGTDNHIWVWFPGYSNSKITLSHPNGSGAFAINKSGSLIFYRDSDNNLRQLYLGFLAPNPPILLGWEEIPIPVVTIYDGVDIDVTDNLLIDEINSRIYFIGSDHAVYYYEWNFNSVNPTGLTKLDHQSSENLNNSSLCEDYYNAAAELTLSHDKNTLYYRGTDYNLWYYYNDRETSTLTENGVTRQISRENWNKTPLEYGHKVSMIAVEATSPGRLFYVGNHIYTNGHWQYDNFLYEVDWVNADNMRTCDANNINAPIADAYAIYKDSSTSSEENETRNDKNKILYNTNVVVHPNPAQHIFTIIMTNFNNSANFEITITDLSGKRVYSVKNILPQESNRYELNWDASGIKQGIYFYRVKLSSGNSVTGKMIKI